MLMAGLLGMLIGAMMGLTGAGGGIFGVPALVFGLGLDIREAAPVALLAVGSASLMVIALLSSVTVSIAWSRGVILGAPAGAFVAAALAGMTGGRMLAPKILQRFFAFACVAVAALILVRSVGT